MVSGCPIRAEVRGVSIHLLEDSILGRGNDIFLNVQEVSAGGILELKSERLGELFAHVHA